MTRSEDHRRAGFTLIELMVVVTVIGIVLTVAAPSLPVGPSASEDDVEIVRRAIQRGAAIAARLDQPMTVAVVAGVRGTPSSDLGPSAIELRLRDSLVSRHLLPETQIVHASSPSVHLLPDGRAMGGPITLETEAGVRVIRIDPWTSRTSVSAP